MKKAVIRKHVARAEAAIKDIRLRCGWIDDELKPEWAALVAALEAIRKETER